ncbi:MAG TPA: NAD(P)-dependent alcohol dehydrogenase, partial [Thermoanaerobaculia bacterium]
MKAVVFTRYGSADVLELKGVEKPAPGNDQVLIRVHAASINDWDWGALQGTPFVNRLMFGLLRPHKQILGSDVAGRIESVGKNVRRFQPGDEVFGDLSGDWGGFAEYVCARESALVLKPRAMTFEQAAAIPQAAMLAVQGLRDVGRLEHGQRVLINGAGGGVGTFAIQLAKVFGAEVTAVDHLEKFDLMRSLGADHVIDYTQEDFTESERRYDLILDVKTGRSILDCARALAPDGAYVTVGGSTGRLLQGFLWWPWISLTTRKK